ncbi:MAG: HEPN domain-containing protein [Bacteroidales bacterium]|nr:HEPN domain-containing protein [Bacteroidales bacterium]
MTLKVLDRETMVKLQMEKAWACMDECVDLVKLERWAGAASRMYYAVFHAVCSLLIRDGHKVKSHKGANVVFSQHYIHTQKLPSEYGKLFRDLETLREESDYNCFYDVTEEEVIMRLEPAKKMIADIEKRLSE